MSQLFSSIELGLVKLPNRIVIAPMCQYSSTNGLANDWHLIHLGQLALSGAGLLILEATAVEAEGRITSADLGLWSDACEAALARVIGSIQQHSAMPLGIQLSHAGRKASSRAPWDGGQLVLPSEGGWVPSGPSAIEHAAGEPPPKAMELADLSRIAQAFADAAQRAYRAGIRVIELHMAHGYLLHQFLSPVSNQRNDDYGGSLQNRLRFPLEVFDAVRAAVPAEVAVGVRISGTDWVEGGWDIAQSVALGHALALRNCVFMHVSSGGISPKQQIPIGPGYQVHLAEQVRNETGLPTMAVGLITEPQQAQDIVAQGRADMIAIARGILYNPHWPWQAAAALGAQVVAPRQYWRSQPRGLSGLFGDVTIGQR